jgi:hypothetical protein
MDKRDTSLLIGIAEGSFTYRILIFHFIKYSFEDQDRQLF